MQKIRVGDDVIVVAGKDKNKRGRVLKFAERDRVVVENVNIAKRHQKGNPQRGVPSGIVDHEMPLHISNVAVYNDRANRGDRIGFKILNDGRKVRYFKSDGEVVDIES